LTNELTNDILQQNRRQRYKKIFFVTDGAEKIS
jgi:hypothetical protein